MTAVPSTPPLLAVSDDLITRSNCARQTTSITAALVLQVTAKGNITPNITNSCHLCCLMFRGSAVRFIFHDQKEKTHFLSSVFLKKNVLWLLSLQRNAVWMVIAVNKTICSPRETWCHFAQLSCSLLLQNLKPLLTFVSWFAYTWTSYSAISQTGEDTETKRSKEMLYLNAARVV